MEWDAFVKFGEVGGLALQYSTKFGNIWYDGILILIDKIIMYIKVIGNNIISNDSSNCINGWFIWR